MEPLSFVVLSFITVGTHIAVDQYNKGNIPPVAQECKVETVKSPNGNYYFERIQRPDGACEYVSKLQG